MAPGSSQGFLSGRFANHLTIVTGPVTTSHGDRLCIGDFVTVFEVERHLAER